jgi:hypothetical protein
MNKKEKKHMKAYYIYEGGDHEAIFSMENQRQCDKEKSISGS